jgi:hypothetical protein
LGSPEKDGNRFCYSKINAEGRRKRRENEKL